MSEETTKIETAERWYGVIDIVQYSLLLALAIYITVWFLILKGRWRNFYISTFYALTCVTAIAKISQIIIEGGYTDKDVWIYVISD